MKNLIYLIALLPINILACPQDQIETPSGCKWVTPPSFYIPSAQTLHCRTVHVLGEDKKYDIDLRWNGNSLDIDRVWESK